MENLTFYLNFKSDSTGEIQITEAAKFDGASFTLEQEKGRYGRDISFGNEEISLVFYDGLYDTTANHLQLPDGTIVYNLTMGLDFLLDYYKRFGFESEVEFIIKKNDVVFTVGILDFQMAKTDLLTFFECKIIQENNRAIIKRREDTNIDVFKSKDLDGNPIEPLTTERILLKAKPVTKISEWGQKTFRKYTNFALPVFSPFQQVIKYGIDDTLSFLSPYADNAMQDVALLRAANLLKNIKIDVYIKYRTEQTPFLDFFIRSGIRDGSYQSNAYNETMGQVDGVTYEYRKTITLDNPMNAGEYLTCAILTGGFSIVDVFECSLIITATSTAVDSVINGVRYTDLFKQCVKSINGMTVNSTRFDVGGEFYNQFAFNGKLIRQFTDKPFNVNFKDLFEDIQEVNGDYQINQDNVFLNVYEDFYTNKEIASFNQVPFDDFESAANDRYAINNFDYRYQTFEQDRDESNTIDAFHTNSQYLLPNKFVENTKKVEVKLVRDPFSIESARRQGIQTKDTTSLENDEKMFVIDVIAMSPTEYGSFANYLIVQNDGGQIKILNSDGENSAIFNWTLLGFKNGDYIQISSDGGSFGTYLVVGLEPTVLTVTGVAIADGKHILQFTYPFTDVAYKNRTSEGFNLIENIDSGDNCSNLRYSIRRNIYHWEQYLATACKYRPTGTIQNTYFRNNGALKSQFSGGQTYTENEDIDVSSLRTAIIDPIIYKTKVVVDFETMVDLLEDLQFIEAGKIGGFIRIADTHGRMVKIHPTKLNYVWASELLEIEGEPRLESEFVEVNTIGIDLVEINEVGYDTDIVFPVKYKTIGNKIQLIDTKGVALINLTDFSKIKVNGIIFDTIAELCQALSEL